MGRPLDTAFLTHHDHAIEPLPDQSALPFWEQDWIAPALKALLFGQPENGQPQRTFFLVDAAMRTEKLGAFDIDTLDLPVKCLFQGDAAEELEEGAPYLIDMTLENGIETTWGDTPSFHKEFFANGWDHNTGVFIRTKASMDEVRSHFRKFTRLQVETDRRWLFFRFWDPRIAPSYFASIATMPTKATQWMTSRGEPFIEAIVGNQADSTDAWQVTPNWDALKGHVPVGTPVLSDAEMKGLGRYRIHRYERRAIKFLQKSAPQVAATLSEDQCLDVIRLSYENAKRRGIASERDHFRYLTAVVLMGSHFEQDPQYAPAIQATRFDDRRYANFDSLLSEVAQAKSGLQADLKSPKRVLLGFERLYSQPLGEVNYELAEEKIRQIWPQYTRSLSSENLHAFIGHAGGVGFALGLTGEDLLMYVCLSIYFGAEFGRDPLFPWALSTLSIPDAEKRRHAFGEAVLEHFKGQLEKSVE